MQKKHVMLLALVFIFSITSFAWPSVKLYEELIPARTTVCWIEGQSLGDMVLGARGSITFVYVDDALKRSLKREVVNAPSWLKEQAVSIIPHRGKAGFVLLIEANKSWNFSMDEIHIAGHRLEKSHCITKPEQCPEGELSSGYSQVISIMIPAQWVPRGKKVAFGYGAEQSLFALPKW